MGVAGAVALSLIAVPASAEARSGRPSQHVHVNSKHHVVVPSTLRPGWVDLHDTGRAPVVVLRGKAAKWGAAQVVKDSNRKSPSALFRHFVVVDVLTGHGDAFVRLSHGSYFFLDAAHDKLKPANVTTVAVKGSARNAVRPVARTVTVSGGGRLTAPATVPAHRYLHLVNRTGSLQAVLMFRVSAQTTDAQLADFVADPSIEKAAALHPTGVQELWEGSGHQAVYVNPHASAGRYVLVSAKYTSSGSGDPFVKGHVAAIKVG